MSYSKDRFCQLVLAIFCFTFSSLMLGALHEPFEVQAILDVLGDMIDMPEVWSMIVLPILAGIIWILSSMDGHKSFGSAMSYLVPLLVLNIVMLWLNMSIVGLFMAPWVLFFLVKECKKYLKSS